jgi:hypothetical protein
LKPTEDWPKGQIVPGVTTIIDSQLGWNKRILIAWARREAMAGRDPDKILLQAGDIGGCVHKMIEAHVKSQIEKEEIKPDLSDYTANDIDKAETAFIAFLDWEKDKELKYINSELRVVSEQYSYGGTVDIIAEKEDSLWLIDPKSSKGIYPEFIVQVAAYANALEEQCGEIADEIHLLHLGKENGEFSDHKISDKQIESAWKVFKCCRKLYELHRTFK